MSLTVGLIITRRLDQPEGIAYDFAQHMAEEGVDLAYMSGEGHSWIPFTQQETLRMLDDFARERGLSRRQRKEVEAWLESLPWVGEHKPFAAEEDGPGIELYFSY